MADANGSPGPEGDQGKAGADKGTPGTIVVGDQTYTTEQVAGLVAEQASVTQKSQELADILTVAERYGVDAPTLMQQAEGAFGVVSDLIGKGLIDEKGQVIEKLPPDPLPGSPNPGTEFMQSQLKSGSGLPPASPPASAMSPEYVSQLINKAMTDKMAPVTKALEGIDQTQTNMIRAQLGKEIRDEYPILDASDVSRVFADAMQDSNKDLYDHAKAAAERKTEETKELRTKFASEFGVDLNEFDENALWEKGPGGGAAVVYKGKKMSFKKGEGAVTPRQATEKYFKSMLKKI